MTEQAIMNLRDRQNHDELLACRVLVKNGINDVHELQQFISNRNWELMAYHFRGMGPVRLVALKGMLKRSGLIR